MRRIRVLICSVDEQTPDEMTELACFDLPATDVTTLRPETALHELEATTHQTGNATSCPTMAIRQVVLTPTPAPVSPAVRPTAAYRVSRSTGSNPPCRGAAARPSAYPARLPARLAGDPASHASSQRPCSLLYSAHPI
jgi:hypothetical protein